MREPKKRMIRKNDHRRNYTLYLQGGLMVSLAIFIIVFKMNWYTEAPEMIIVDQQEIVEMEEVIQTKQVDTPPPPPRPPVPVEVPNDEIVEDEILDLDAELDLDGPLDLPPPPPPTEDEPEEDIFVVVEQPPVLKGGIAGVQKRIKYPEMARQAGIEGRVVVQFVVDANGKVVNPVVVRSIGGGCDEEALRAVQSAEFEPGRQRGKPVKVRYTLPITFSLSN